MVYIARARSGSTAASKELAVTARSLVAAVERRPTAPAAAGDFTIRFDGEVRPGVDQTGLSMPMIGLDAI